MGDVRIHCGDALDVLRGMEAESFDAVAVDPPYELGFMGKAWDRSGVAFDPATWEAVLRVVKPGGCMLAMGGSRTYHRLACAVEDAGWEIRDCLMWVYATGFPKGAGCLKPAYEPILLARKPGPRVLPLGIDECRVPLESDLRQYAVQGNGKMGCHGADGGYQQANPHPDIARHNASGRYPANVLHDGSEEVLEAFAAFGEKGSGDTRELLVKAKRRSGEPGEKNKSGHYASAMHGDSGTAARFFYAAKASKAERGEGNGHPTVKPLALMRWLVRLVCPRGGLCLDPFGGSGTAGVACLAEGRRAVLIEKEAAYCDIIRKRIADYAPLFATLED